mgnify:CR=1 FL=1
MTELTEQILMDALYLEKDTEAQHEGYTAYKSKGIISETDYLENIALFGTKSDGKKFLSFFRMQSARKHLNLKQKTLSSPCLK